MGQLSTIFALSSAPGRAAVAVIRVSGRAVRNVLQGLTSSIPEPRRAMLRTLRHPVTGQELDQALVLFFAAPASETGEDLAELQVHGGRAVIAAVLDALAAIPGCRMAAPGEFVRRAFDNGKLELTAVEGLADLIDAETDGQRRQALAQASGGLARHYDGWRQRLIEASALVEAAIDFSDEADVSDNAVAQGEAIASTLVAEFARHLDDGHRGEILREGFRVVLAGPPNAGKSSLLNALARRDVAIVSSTAGTTRDVIEVRLDLGGMPVIVSDTAGIRDAASGIEAEGIRRTLARAAEADLVLWLTDATAVSAVTAPAELAGLPLLRLQTKVDLLAQVELPSLLRGGVGGGGPQSEMLARAPEQSANELRDQAVARRGAHSRPPPPTPPRKGEGGQVEGGEAVELRVSAVTGEGLPELTQHLAAAAHARIGATGEAPLITQARHRQLLEQATAGLRAFLTATPPELELRAEELRRAAAALGRITGRIDVEDVLDQVFGRFCIGK